MLARNFADQTLEENPPPPGDGGADWEGGWPQTPAQFETLIERFQGRLFRYAFRRLGSIQDAEDVVQEVFITAYAERERRRKVIYVRAYLYRMTANACHRQLARRQRRPAALADLGGAEVCDIRPTPAGAAASAETAARLDRLLGRLPERQAEVVRLRFFDELRFAEIAEVLECSVATVKSRLRYGLEKLQRLMVREEE